MSPINTYQLGNTIRLTGTFKDFDNVIPIKPEVVKFIVYDASFVKLSETVVSDANSPALGTYRYYYTPDTVGRLTYEWYCEKDGLPSLKRTMIEVKKI